MIRLKYPNKIVMAQLSRAPSRTYTSKNVDKVNVLGLKVENIQYAYSQCINGTPTQTKGQL